MCLFAKHLQYLAKILRSSEKLCVRLQKHHHLPTSYYLHHKSFVRESLHSFTEHVHSFVKLLHFPKQILIPVQTFHKSIVLSNFVFASKTCAFSIKEYCITLRNFAFVCKKCVLLQNYRSPLRIFAFVCSCTKIQFFLTPYTISIKKSFASERKISWRNAKVLQEKTFPPIKLFLFTVNMSL